MVARETDHHLRIGLTFPSLYEVGTLPVLRDILKRELRGLETSTDNSLST